MITYALSPRSDTLYFAGLTCRNRVKVLLEVLADKAYIHGTFLLQMKGRGIRPSRRHVATLLSMAAVCISIFASSIASRSLTVVSALPKPSVRRVQFTAVSPLGREIDPLVFRNRSSVRNVRVMATQAVQKSDEEWRAVLSPEQFRILRQKGTE